MSTNEIPRGGPLSAPTLRSFGTGHVLRDFDLKVIMQISGCERGARRLLRGEPLSTADVGPLTMANHAARHMGYLPLFELGGQGPSIGPEVEAVLCELLEKPGRGQQI
ncbi:hypothetical protein ACFUOZ_18120 [Paenarthrobacter sp. NPDC057355]|uniref:hypothetical protein n=1 Tax=Paenarthrobacter sp. NPDC057355 TaxID=3346105 RepID=UPI00363805DC